MPAMDIERARFNMVEQQIRTWEVLDQRVLELIGRSPRENYVPAAYRKLAFADTNIPIGHGQVMMQPKMEARLLQELEIASTDKILQVGVGTGYLTSLLASSGKQVYGVEIFPDLAQDAAEKLETHGHKNVSVEIGDAVEGWKKFAPYNVIVFTGSVPILSEAVKAQLAPGGRLFVIVGKSPVMEALLITRLQDGSFGERSLFETDLPPLANAKAPAKFIF